MSSTASDALRNKATQKELAGDLDAAFALYVQATQSYLHLSRTSNSPAARDLYKVSATRCLERAERIKATKRDLPLIKKNPFSPESQSYILSKSTVRNGIRLPVWKEGNVTSSSSTFKDPDGLLPISKQQGTVIKGWKRANELIRSNVVYSAQLAPEDLTQGNPSDCSVIASLAVCLNHHKSFASRLALDALYPHDPEGLPTRSNSGIYKARLYLNGQQREITIDDRLPVEDGVALACAGTRHADHLWPSLMEKAYLKVNGGYDFGGSNSCIDVHALTGWIPEFISFTRGGARRLELWDRIYGGYTAGKCVITLNTPLAAAPFGLIANHSYAVLGLTIERERRFISVLNSLYAETRSTPGGDNHLLELDWDIVCDQFTGLSLNWNPSLFSHSQTLHSEWPSGAPGQASNHRFRIRATSPHVQQTNSGSDIWCLLTRHTRTKQDDADFVALHWFASSDDETPISLSRDLQEAYTDSPHCLAVVSGTAAANGISIVASRYASGNQDCGYTLQVFSHFPVVFEDASDSLPYRKEIPGSLTSFNSGGHSMHPTFMNNPQYSLVIHALRPSSSKALRGDNEAQPSSVFRLALEGSKDAPLNVKLLWAGGRRATDVSQGDIALDSGPYNYGFVYASGALKAGQYTIAVSSFEPRTCTDYTLVMESSTSFDVTPIPSESAGRFSKVVKGAWEEGAPAAYRLVLPQQTELQFRLQHVEPGIRIPIKLSVHPEASVSKAIATSDWSDATSGVVTDRISCSPGNYLIVPSSSRGGTGRRFVLFVYSSACPVIVTAAEGA